MEENAYRYGLGFQLSSSEYEFGQDHSENYVIYYVSEVKENPTITIIDDIFVDGEFNAKKYSKKPDSYLIQAETEIADEAGNESDS